MKHTLYTLSMATRRTAMRRKKSCLALVLCALVAGTASASASSSQDAADAPTPSRTEKSTDHCPLTPASCAEAHKKKPSVKRPSAPSSAPKVVRTAPVAPAPIARDPVQEAKSWQDGGSARPVIGPDGLLQYPHGQGQPELVCSPLHACDIQLQEGEAINNVILGDTVRWIPAPAKTGDGAQAIPHVILKPTESGLKTNLIITTNRRTYTLSLTSSEERYTSRVGFYYPADMVQSWRTTQDQQQREADEKQRRTIDTLSIQSLDQLNMDAYTIKGDRSLPWYPVRVFDDGTRVWIQMPASARSSEAPALVLLGSDGEAQMVNYRVKEANQGGVPVTYYIVDTLFERAGLIVGVGRSQKKIEIIRVARKGGHDVRGRDGARAEPSRVDGRGPKKMPYYPYE